MFVTIRKIISSGDGIGWGDGKTYFVPRVLPGETVEVREAVPLRRSFRVTDFRIVEPSPVRQEPICPLFGQCGGCSFLHIPYPLQNAIKCDMVKETFRQQGVSLAIEPRWVSVGTFRLRSRAKVHIFGGRPAFNRRADRGLVPFDDCPLLHRGLASVIRDDASHRENGVLHYEYAPRSGGWIPRDRAVEKVVAGEVFRVSRGSFFQSSEEGAGALADMVDGFIGKYGPAAVLDLFCGVGLFSRFAAKAGCAVTGIDITSSEDFSANVPGGRFLKGDLSRPMSLPPVDFIVLDPPRAGVAASLVEAIARNPARSLCYISCDAATLVRDIGRLARRGRFLLRSLTLVDQFPFTHRIELVAHLMREET